MSEGISITFDSASWTKEKAEAWLVEKGLGSEPWSLVEPDDGEETTDVSELLVVKADTDLRLVTGPVLIPGVVDLQKDLVSADEVRKAAHWYLKNSRVVKNQHAKPANVHVVESWTTDRKTKHVVGERKVVLPQGTWMMTGEVVDPGLWKDVKSGKKRGWSIGGTARDATKT